MASYEQVRPTNVNSAGGVASPSEFPQPHQQFPAKSSAAGGFGLREVCFGLGFLLIAIGVANLNGIYMWPRDGTCAMYYGETQDELDTDFAYAYNPTNNPPPPPSNSLKWEYDKVKDRRTKCNIFTRLYTASNVLFFVASCASGVCLSLAAAQRRSTIAIATVAPLLLSMIFIIVQAVPVFMFSVVRYVVNVFEEIAEAGAKDFFETPWNATKLKPDRPLLNLNGQRAFSVLGCLFFLAIYLGFGMCALLFWEKLRSKGRKPGAASGAFPAQQQPQTSNSQLQQQASYDQAHPFGMQASTSS